MRTDPFAFKTAEFVKRNFNRIRSILSHGMYEMRKIGRGFRNLKKDVGYAMGLRKDIIIHKYKNQNYEENVKMRQVQTDVIKFIPFSFFILIPGAEILLPPFLMVFPNSVPSQFMSKEARNKKF